MVTNNSKSSFRVKLIWLGIILTCLLFVLQRCKVLDWPVWSTFIPFTVALIVFMTPYAIFIIAYVIGVLYIKSEKRALKTICKKMVQIIQATDENNVVEQVKLCLENARLIKEKRNIFKKIPVPDDSVNGYVRFFIENREFNEKLEALSDQTWTEETKEEVINLLKENEANYSNLWF